MSFEQYLKKNLDRNIIDHVLWTDMSQKGHPKFYIHPAGVEGDTLNFLVDGDDLVPFEKGEVIR